MSLWRLCVPPIVLLALALSFCWRLWTPISGARGTFGWDSQYEYWGDLQFQVDSYRSGELPLWNPYDRGGYPLHADPQAGVLYPFTWLLVAAGLLLGKTPWWLIAVKDVAHLWWAELGIYAYLRHRRQPAWCAYAGAILLAMSYPMFTYAPSSLNWGFAWAPWVLLAVDRWAERPEIGRGALVGVAAAMCLLAGSPAAFWYSMLVAVPYAVWALVHHGRRGEDRAAYVKAAAATGAAAAGIFVGITAAQVASTLALLPHTVRANRSLSFITAGVFDLRDLMTFAVPRLNGLNAYLGAGTVLWMALLLIFRPTPRRWVLVGIAAAGVLLALGDQTDVLAYCASVIPAFGLFRRAQRYLYTTQLAVAILGAEGLAAAAAIAATDARARARRIIAAAGALGVAIFAVSFAAVPGTGRALHTTRGAYALACAAVAVFSALTYALLGSEGTRRRVLTAVCVVALGLDLWVARGALISWGMYPIPVPRHDKEVATLSGVPMTWRIYDRGYLDFRPGTRLHVRDFGGYINDPLALGRYARMRDAASPRILGHAGVKYVLGTGDPQHRTRLRMQSRLKHLRGRIYEVPVAAPSVFWVRTATVVDDLKQALASLGHSRPGTVAVVARSDVSAATASRVSALAQAAAPVTGRFVSYDRDHVVASIDAPAAGVAVIGESYYPGWKVTVDGHPAHMFPVNVQFRGVLVGPGRHRIDMRYQPPAYRTLAALSLISLAGALALALWDTRRRRSRSAPTAD